MNFEKYLFNISINGWSISKYVDNSNDKIELRVEKGGKIDSAKCFNLEQYEDFYDKHEDIYNNASALNSAIEEIAGWRL